MAAPIIPPPLVALAGFAAQRFMTRRRADPCAPTIRSTSQRVAAAGLAMAGLALMAAADVEFARVRTTVDPLRPQRASSLVTGGVFGATRNPMYLGLAAVLTANAVWTGRVRSVVPVVAFVGWIDRLQVPAEEQALSEIFGPPYDGYRASTRRWL